MSVLDIIADAIIVSGRDDIEDNKNICLRWLNNYKLYLQRDKRISFTQNTIPFVASMNVRTTDLPSDFLHIMAIRRKQACGTGVTQDAFGNQFEVPKKTLLTRHVRREDFLSQFPIQRSSGELYVGTVNDYLLFGESVIWGPIPIQDEQFELDYYRLYPKYDLTDNIEDGFTKYFEDGLYKHLLEMIFTEWIPDDKKAARHYSDKIKAEGGIKKYQVAREFPMEVTINMPDL